MVPDMGHPSLNDFDEKNLKLLLQLYLDVIDENKKLLGKSFGVNIFLNDFY